MFSVSHNTPMLVSDCSAKLAAEQAVDESEIDRWALLSDVCNGWCPSACSANVHNVHAQMDRET